MLSILYLSYFISASGENVELPTKPKAPPLDDPEVVTTVSGAKVRVTRHGNIELVPEEGHGEDSGSEDGYKPVKMRRKMALGSVKKSKSRKRRSDNRSRSERKGKKRKANSSENESKEEIKLEPEESLTDIVENSTNMSKSARKACPKKATQTLEPCHSPAKKTKLQKQKKKSIVA